MSSAALRRAVSPPSPEELIQRARDLVPEIRARAEETERNRRISPEIIAKVRDAELLRTTRPREFGGFEYDAVVALEIALTISAACASTGWAVNGALSNGISFGHYPIETQRELWGDGSDPFSCACFAPTGAAVPADGGYRLSGKWSFASGVDHASWIRLGAFIKSPDSDDAEPATAPGPATAPFSYCRSAMSKSSTTGLSMACAAPAAKTSSSKTPLSPRIACCGLPTPAPGTPRGPTITTTRSTDCRYWCWAPRCWPRPRSARPRVRFPTISK